MQTSSPTQDSLPSIVDTFEDLIPKELKDAYKEDDVPLAKEQPQMEQEDPLSFLNKQQPKILDPDIDDDEDFTTTKPNASNPDDDELEITSSKDIDDLISGNLDSVSKSAKNKVKQKEAPLPLYEWHNNEAYKAIVKNHRIKQEDLDKLIQEQLDTKVLTTSNYAKKVEEESEKYKNELNKHKQELLRLKQIEKDVYFDLQPETQETYGKPMQESIKEIQKVLQVEGSTIPINQILMAKDRVALNTLLKDEYLTASDLNQVVNHWRAYKDVEFRYNTAKSVANNSVRASVHTSIDDNDANRLMDSSLVQFMTSDKRYDYIKDAIMAQTPEKPIPEDIKKITDTARNNFKAITRALSNPIDYARNQEWLEVLAKHMLDSSHARHIENKYYTLQTEATELKAQRDKLVKAYRDLASSGRGIDGNRAVAGVFKKQPNSRDNQDDNDVKMFEDFIAKKIRFDELM